MKIVRTILAAVFLYITAMARGASDRPSDSDMRALMVAVAQILEQSQYSQQELNSSVGRQVLETYLGALDPDKLFLTHQDVNQIRANMARGSMTIFSWETSSPRKKFFRSFGGGLMSGSRKSMHY